MEGNECSHPFSTRFIPREELETLPSDNPINDQSSREILSGDVVIRSIEMVRMDENVYVLCAMGDGTLFYILINPHTREYLIFDLSSLFFIPLISIILLSMSGRA